MTRKGKGDGKAKKKVTPASKGSNKEVLKEQTRILEETIEILDSDDDFVIPNPVVRVRREVPQTSPTKPVNTQANKQLDSRRNVKNDSEDSDTDCTAVVGDDDNGFVTTFAETSSCLLSSSSGGAFLEESKDAWKGLMQLMQTNQKDGLGSSKTFGKSKKGKKIVKSGTNAAVPNKSHSKTFVADSKSQSDCVIVSSTPVQVTRSISGDTNFDIHKSSSPPKRLKMDVLPDNITPEVGVGAQSPDCDAESHVEEVNGNSAPSEPTVNLKIPTMFLKPEERAARAVQEKLEKAKICERVCPEHVLAQLATEPLHYDSAVESPEYFNGNVVKLNGFTPLEDPYGGNKTKQCPFYKKLPGTTFSVDAFNYGLIPGIEVYFLSHYHSDHYIGLTKKFCKTLVCSPPTANLVRMKLGVDEKCIRKLQLNKSYVVDGVEVILISANHCPGSVMFIFKLPNGTVYFHTGDFRFTVDMMENYFLQGLRIDVLYLDTTYCDPKFDFPTQTDAITELITVVRRKLDFRPKTLILCGSYLIGKERVYFSLAEALQTKVFLNYEKRRIIQALENPLFDSYVSSKEEEAGIHVIQMFSIEPKFLSEYLSSRSNYTHIIGIKPTGWQFSSSGSGSTVRSHNNDTVTIIGVPYSEHSSFSELHHFVKATKPRKVQPTVNVGSVPKRNAIMEHIAKWQVEG